MEASSRIWLKAAEYRAFGGVKQAIASTAEEVYASSSESEQDRLRDIFLRLTRLDEDGEGRDTRRRVPIRELIPAKSNRNETTHLLDKLSDARLIVKTNKEVEVAHEALIRHWNRLLGWLNEDRGNLHLREGVIEDAREWENSGRDESLLNHRGSRLELALAMSIDQRYQLNPIEQSYLDACVEVKERARIEKEEQQRRELEAAKKLAETAQAKAQAERRGRQVSIGMLFIAIILIVVLGFNPTRNQFLRQKAMESEMMSIPAGAHELGDPNRDENFPSEYLPLGQYDVASFSIDTTPVSNRRYGFCIEANICSRPNALRAMYENQADANKPVVHITAADAAQFCSWLGMRLPSDKEWELAARLKIFKSAGKIKEWTLTPYNYLDEKEWTDMSEDPPELITKKGGSLGRPLEEIWTFRQSASSTESTDTTGFRCAIDD